jgi:hypothetical protein
MTEQSKILNNTTTYINNLYDNLSFVDLHFTSILSFLFLTTIVILASIYCSIMRNSQEIRNNWETERCNPKNMPFVGLINKPTDQSIFEYTANNFSYCVKDILSGNLDTSMRPFNINGLLDDAKNAFNNIDLSLNGFDSYFENLEKSMYDKIEEMKNKMVNVIIPIQKIMYAMEDTYARTQAIFATALYTTMGNSYIIKSMIQESINFITNIFYLLLVLISIMFVVPGTQGLATVTSAIAIPLSAVFIAMNISLGKTFHITPGKMPNIPKCFDKNTKLKMNDGTYKTIENICVGDILEKENMVTAIIKLDSSDVVMNNLNGVIVSDMHIVEHKNKWGYVSSHPYKVPINNYCEPYIYCLNTTNKLISVNNTNFLDWDELYDFHLEKILTYQIPNYNFIVGNKKNIHKYLDGGFDENTKIIMADYTSKKIKDILVGDVLLNNEVVYGLVQVKGDDLFDVSKYNLGYNDSFKGGANLNIMDVNNYTYSILDSREILQNPANSIQHITKPPKLYHLLTDTKTFYVGNIKFCDYNSLIDTILNKK